MGPKPRFLEVPSGDAAGLADGVCFALAADLDHFSVLKLFAVAGAGADAKLEAGAGFEEVSDHVNLHLG